MVQLSLAGPVTVASTQVNELNSGEFVAPAAIPVPLSPTTSDPLVSALLVIVNCPVVVPIMAGEKFTLMLNVPPAATVMGRSPPPLTENACPTRLICDTCTVADP